MARHLITSALPYINGVKHLGNLIGSMLPADVLARYLRLAGNEVLFLCGTDEHGTPAELAAAEAGLDVAEYCRQQHEIQRDLCSRFLLSFDHFGRSSSRQNAELTQLIARQLESRGLIEEREVDQIYSIADDRFLPDRYVVGTCPHCGYDAARGDQCENCTRLLDPTDLLSPRSAISGSSTLEVRRSRHLFLLQSKMADKLRAWIDAHPDWPLLVTSIGNKWLTEGLKDRCITRDLDWGVPVDRPGFEGKVFYVWFDAPIEYIGAAREWADADPTKRDWESWWRDGLDVHYTQFMAKDNVPFHVISFPGTLMGTGDRWKVVDYIKGFNWLNYYGGKFSTSKGVGVFMDTAIELLPADYWRWFLLANAPESDDTAFTWQTFAASVNKDLADTLGNFVNRTLAFAERRFGSQVPSGGQLGPAENELASKLDVIAADYTMHLERSEFRKSARALRQAWALGNSYLEQSAPWIVARDDSASAAGTVRTAINLIRIFAILAAPFVPESSDRVLEAIGLPRATEWLTSSMISELQHIRPGHAFAVPDVVFRKITDAEIDDWTQRFGGRPSDELPQG